MSKRLRLILGDQLNHHHSWYDQKDDNTIYLLAELLQETGYVDHHIQKVCAFFSAMEHFAEHLRSKGHRVVHLTLDDTGQYATLDALLIEQLVSLKATAFEYQLPDEFRLRQQLAAFNAAGVCVTSCSSEHFIIPDTELEEHFTTGKAARMEHFYRNVRRRMNVLMEGNQPLGGQWNYDAANRKKIRKQDLPLIPAPLIFANDLSDILKRIKKHKVTTIGHTEGTLLWPVNREQGLALLEHFCEYCLPLFGRFQDAMTTQSRDAWSLFHSRLSFAINAKLLSPEEVVAAAIKRFEKPDSNIELSSIEGFVRQIIGWREFVRGVYWLNMPEYADRNALNATRALPGFFWNGDTKMRCLSATINQSLDTAYAHHIQRLMITGNFCLLAGIDPDAVDAWYLGIYVDALEWVEMPNTRGMSQFADGGLVGSKPYAASGNYVNKMSDYCSSCQYAVKEKHGDSACPLNSLYWRFMDQHRSSLERNPRIGMVYRNWDKQPEAQRAAILAHAETCLVNIEAL